MPINVAASSLNADVENYIQDKVLPLVQRQLVAYALGDKLTLPKGRGTTYTASRYDRINLPYAPLSEGIPPAGQSFAVVQVSAVAQQWGDLINVTDVAGITIKHPAFNTAINLIKKQAVELLERNTFNTLLAGSQINTVNSRGSRAGLAAGDVINLNEINRAVGMLHTIGAPKYDGQTEDDTKLTAGKAASPVNAHYVGILHPFVEQDLRSNPTVMTAWSYSDKERIYNDEIGSLSSVRFTRSNMVPFFTGVAAVSATAGTAGSLATGSYYVQVTGSVNANGYEQRVHQVSGAAAVTGPNGSLSVTLPSTPGFTYSVYVGTTTSPTNLGVSPAGPTSGSLVGQATQLLPGATVVITAVGAARTPPAAPATGVTVYPTFIIGKNAYGQITLDSMEMSYLSKPDKSDPLNQTRTVGWKIFWGTILLNQNFFMRVESTSAGSLVFA
jgi:N4-gp56 family major capsid protein